MTTTDPVIPTGPIHHLTGHGYEAEVVAVGAGLRALRHLDRELLVSWPREVVRPMGRGAVLAPWPNRIADGRYRWNDADHQLALTEPDRANAIHGLIQWVRFEVAEESADLLRFSTQVVPQPGYPWPLDLAVEYRLTESGLTWSVIAGNPGDQVVPYGVAPHPYLVAPGSLDDWTVSVPADTVLEVTEDRLLPVGTRPVEGTELDLRRPTVLGDRRIDHAYTDLISTDEFASVSVQDADGIGARMRWSTAQCPWVQIHTADRPEPENDRVGLAVEPMTCPPDAFRTGTDVIALQPGAQHRVDWELSAIGG